MQHENEREIQRGDNPNEVEGAETSKDIPQLDIKDEYFPPPIMYRMTKDQVLNYMKENHPSPTFQEAVISMLEQLTK